MFESFLTFTPAFLASSTALLIFLLSTLTFILADLLSDVLLSSVFVFASSAAFAVIKGPATVVPNTVTANPDLIRPFLDKTFLPLIFLLWYQPSFLKRISKTTTLIASFFLLTLWLDAARANWLGISVGLSAIVLFYPKGYQKILKPLISILISFILYRIIQCFDTSAAQYTVLREEDGTRWRMWLNAWHHWLANPLMGLGGGNFVFAKEINPLKIGHPHNLIVQLVVEWGVTGLLISFLIVYIVRWIFNKRSQLPAILFAGIITLLVNMLLSGAHVYPVSQMTMLIYFCFVMSNIQINLNSRSIYFLTINKFNDVKEIKILKWGLGFILIILFIISDSFFQYGNDKGMVNSSPSLGPRFWSNAHLVNME